ncbi:serine/threonine-protein kinase [Actinomadura flavalba]|uniref:serine/threonine-protein kinase n=1 Tax=Actinomadura flavalba TaxID=1120938 RepID=UPI0003A698D9|nr:serine/threonine-protein kinase [Actinomadura flavalba]
MEALGAVDPEQVGRYRIEGRLGSGGMGAVFLGRSPGGRAVAVKVIRPELAGDAEFRRRFAVEVDAARRVGGFHTAPIVDADPDGDPPYLVTAHVAGPSLADALDLDGPLPEAGLLALGAGLAEALDAVHRAGIAHRDLKPSNIILAADGPRVIDFGIARALDATSLTRTGASAGTPGYMAPEQVTGDASGPAADVFALGVVLCRAAGVAPFGEGPTHALLYRVVHGEPDLDGLPASLRDVVAACLAKDPDARPGPAALVERLAAPGAHPPRADAAERPTPAGPATTRDSAERNASEPDASGWSAPGDATARDTPTPYAPARDVTTLEEPAHDTAGRNAAAQDAAGRNGAGREMPARDTAAQGMAAQRGDGQGGAGRDAAGLDMTARDADGRESGGRGVGGRVVFRVVKRRARGDLGVGVAGLGIAVAALVYLLVAGGWSQGRTVLVCAPLIVLFGAQAVRGVVRLARAAELRFEPEGVRVRGDGRAVVLRWDDVAEITVRERRGSAALVARRVPGAGGRGWTVLARMRNVRAAPADVRAAAARFAGARWTPPSDA